MVRNRRHQLLVLLAVTISVFIAPRFVAAQTEPGSVAKTGSQLASKDGTSSHLQPLKLPLCPEAGVSPLHTSKVSRHHKVTLTWKASVLSKQAISNPVGYCLYRSERQGLAKMAMAIPNVRCGGCEQVNRVPIAGTGCVDDLVKDNETYYYVVTAITGSGQTSSSSDEAIVEIPRRKRGATVPSAYPSCRTPDLSQ